MFHQETCDKLLHACQQLMRHRQVLAKPTIKSFILRRVDPSTPNVDLLSHLIAEALLKRLDHELLQSLNIYVEPYDIPQIELFYRMAEAYPHIYASHAAANHYLAHAMTQHREVTLLEIGIGKGVQLERLMELLAARSDRLTRRVCVIGVDPDERSLAAAESSLLSQHHSQLVVEFKPLQGLIEEIPEDVLTRICGDSGGHLVVNSGYTLHHASHPIADTQARTDMLGRLARLKPLVFTAIEPSSDHDTENVTLRLHACWEHFSTVFELIDESALSAMERFVIKERFFGREIRDMFGVSDRMRCERHEPYTHWLLRLHRVGFRPCPRVPVELSLPSCCEARFDEGLIRLGYRGITLIAVMAHCLEEEKQV